MIFQCMLFLCLDLFSVSISFQLRPCMWEHSTFVLIFINVIVMKSSDDWRQGGQHQLNSHQVSYARLVDNKSSQNLNSAALQLSILCEFLQQESDVAAVDIVASIIFHFREMIAFCLLQCDFSGYWFNGQRVFIVHCQVTCVQLSTRVFRW